MAHAAKTPFGTAFVPSGKVLRKELWDKEVRIEEFGDLPEYSRKLEIALDFVACMASSNLSHLLDQSFDDILNDDEKQLKRGVLALQSQIGNARGSTFASTREFLSTFGPTTD